MAGGFKRGGLRGGASSGFKKGSVRKRSPAGETDAPRANKKSKIEDEEEDAETPVIPKLQTDEDSNPFIAVSSRKSILDRVTYWPSSITAANGVSRSATSKA